MLINIINKAYDWIYKKIKLIFLNNNFKIKKEGKIFIGKTFVKTLEVKKITKIVLQLIKRVEKKSYKTFYKKSQIVDEFKINMNFLITFETIEGFRAVEKNLVRSEFEINKQDYKETERLIHRKLVLLFEEYNIVSIDEFIIKMF